MHWARGISTVVQDLLTTSYVPIPTNCATNYGFYDAMALYLPVFRLIVGHL